MKYSDVEYYPQYGNIEYLKPASVTPYAKNNYTKYTGEKLSVNKSGNGAYYLRDIDDACYGVLFVNRSGMFRNVCRCYEYTGIRPIIKVRLDFENYE